MYVHSSQRVPDEQAVASAIHRVRPAVSTPGRRSIKPRPSRPKPPRDETAEERLRRCREGRLFELQAWVAAGKSLSVPTPLPPDTDESGAEHGIPQPDRVLVAARGEAVREGQPVGAGTSERPG